ncbi:MULTISPECIES: phage Gp37/Gp68 family protein [Pseudodesulfovibrio]|uniref:Gp37Gp68 family protein n=1 Tax=Pseudodesulfovibrio aespoeensis (strain ATCC 700646 / DSM 10631 / Aspo-2) TaxID=643562 RepID=E6VXH0_PSEA9|nr:MULTISPECIES: phage Gp37/Gp68 family protein [Pseudodesulfovibrio]ADU63786.1 Gp37Gp68 family protein [Pseudodesulfovibrio aespoeensis Aspo-2]MBU4380575.1 phage Gp37/Gp68 family protein [Pseudomonadota bacterium]MBV1765728.1 phage Gp37/Gp68 family protein [Pseudodesulfovibrio sp.]MCG2731499.1 phage Gp37/Gp68 family protein [Pseudodesulfovibrio aespoeensis]
MPSKIEWTEETWNPSVGCTKISPGCINCYAEVMAKRLQSMKMVDYAKGFKFTILPHRLSQPVLIKRPTIFFVNSMSDLFHEEMPGSFIDEVLNTICKTPQHRYQILTKRSDRMLNYFASRVIPENVMLGVTVENVDHGIPRIDDLRQLSAAKVRFLSIEPLLEDLGFINLEGINWVIVGGESGPRARQMESRWVVNIRNQCVAQNIPFYFKQWGTWGADSVKRSKKKNGRLLEGKEWIEMPRY